jgi:Chalcone isomerase-like
MFAVTVSFWLAAHAAELDGVQFPDTQLVDGKTLHLNGYGLRTYSILGIHIYVAGLYVEHLSTDPVNRRSSSSTGLGGRTSKRSGDLSAKTSGAVDA